MDRRLLSGAALVLIVALTSSAGAFETGGQQVAPDFQISPLTAAIVQSAQARIFAGNATQAQQRGAAVTAPDGSITTTGNPAFDQALGISGTTAQQARSTLHQQLIARAQDLLARRGAGTTAAIGDAGFFGSTDPSGFQTGGVPVFVQNVTNSTTQTGVFNTVTATTNVAGNNNAVSQAVGNVGNNSIFKGKAQ
jgi:hypothetical protein